MRYLLAIGLSILLGMSSCSKCTVCTKSGDPDVRVCEKDYDSHTAYGLAVDIYEAQNYDCHKAP